MMESKVPTTRRDAAIEARVNALPVNAAHREMAVLEFRHGLVRADRAYELIGKLRTTIGEFRAAASERNRYIG